MRAEARKELRNGHVRKDEWKERKPVDWEMCSGTQRNAAFCARTIVPPKLKNTQSIEWIKVLNYLE